jgi:hypothetical protein
MEHPIGSAIDKALIGCFLVTVGGIQPLRH